ncbi:alpha/beta hydrolase [Streptomyces cavernae]|uniref:alpha/beta hydrolase n=1 Tax=Streptomyces cavernae TaxID=2259034 RepID=UPI001EE4EAC6|nr:alpha/beta fold hydrolase [Streptomyces cavernae]
MSRHQALTLDEGLGGKDGGSGEKADRTGAVVLFLHGGREDGDARPTRWNLPGLRMLPFARAVRAATAGQGIATAHVRYRHRGWNGTRADAVADAQDALEEIERRFGPVPVVLVGHSMGGRAALRLGGHATVRSVVALAPWCPPGEPVNQLTGTPTVILHSDRDRTTEPLSSHDFAVRARAAGTPVCRMEIAGSDHAMLRRATVWHTTTARLVAGFLGVRLLPPSVSTALSLREGEPSGLDLAVTP